MAAIQTAPAPLTEAVDVLLADIAVRIQLSPTNYRLAVQRYNAVSQWIEREDSPLSNRVELFYPQGSMAIGATISASIEGEEFDIDLIAQLDVAPDTPPGDVLDLLDESVRGEPGSRYYDKTTRCTRCVQIQYGDDMHLDVTPMVRLRGRPEREGLIFHAREDGPHDDDQTILANPHGFAEWFLANTPAQLEFAQAFAAREAEYDRMVALAKAETEPVPQQEAAQDKSMALITLQLFKRWRNLRYADRTGRYPASVLLARLIADNANQTRTLSEEVLFQAKQMHALFAHADRTGQLVDIRNPTCPADDFTDRWPCSVQEQAVFLEDLGVLVAKLEQLCAGCSLATMRTILSELFGERPAGDAIVALNRKLGDATMSGRSFHDAHGGRLDLAASGVIAVTSTVAASSVRATPVHTNFGGD